MNIWCLCFFPFLSWCLCMWILYLYGLPVYICPFYLYSLLLLHFCILSMTWQHPENLRKTWKPLRPLFPPSFQKLLLILKGQFICSIGHELSCVAGKHCVVVSTKMKCNNKQQVDLWVVEFIVFIVSVDIRKENKDEVLNSIKKKMWQRNCYGYFSSTVDTTRGNWWNRGGRHGQQVQRQNTKTNKFVLCCIIAPVSKTKKKKQTTKHKFDQNEERVSHACLTEGCIGQSRLRC